MGNSRNHSDSATRQQLLEAALKCFARQGYAATSVQEIVSAARVSKPVLYYYFADKAALFQAVVDSALDERYRLMRAAAERGRTVGEKLREMVADVFAYAVRNRELMRLTFATAFAASGAGPGEGRCREKGRRNFEFIRSLIQQGQQAGELTCEFSSEDLAMGIYGLVNSYVMIRLLVPDCPLHRHTAIQIVKLFLRGAGQAHSPNGHSPASAGRRHPKHPAPNSSRV